jgi:hypothetical protein
MTYILEGCGAGCSRKRLDGDIVMWDNPRMLHGGMPSNETIKNSIVEVSASHDDAA